VAWLGTTKKDGTANGNGMPAILRAYTRPGLGFKELRKGDGEARRTKGGQKLTDQKTIDVLVATTEAQKAFVACRKKLGKVSAALTKSLEFFNGVCLHSGGVFHAEINQTKTATHRTSSTGIPQSFVEVAGEEPVTRSAQFQNLPNAFKPLFCARGPGRLLAEADGSQLEFRTAGQVSGDEQMIEDILNPEFDAHVTSAAAMKGVSYEELLAKYRAGDAEAGKWRKAAKPDTFGPLYGKSRGSPEQMRWIEEFRRRYAGFYTFSEANVHRVLADKVLALPWGMRYYWPHAKLGGGDYINCRTAVYNYPIQGFATAEIIPIAVACFRQRIAEAEASGKIKAGDVVILNTVHDSIICDIAESALEVWKEIALNAFTLDVYAYLRNVYHYEFDRVPLGVGMNYGTHWADPENTEEEWDVYPTGQRVKRK
jgi:DNA polymerase I-like protein with 3'-5' exonuclease and polymerase domains